MKILKGIGIAILAILAIYAIYAIFVPMRIGEKIVEREIIQQSPQYVISQRSALTKLYTEYVKSDGAVKKAIKLQMCEIAINLPRSETPSNVLNICE